MEISHRIKLMAFISKLIGNFDAYKNDFAVKISEHNEREIKGSFEVSGSLARELGGLFSGEKTVYGK